MPVDNTVQLKWESNGLLLTERDINLLFEIFGPLPVHDQFTMRGDSLIGLGKSRILIQNQDQLSDALYGYLNVLSIAQQTRVKELITKWVKLDTKVVKFATAERVRFRVSAPEEGRYIIKKRLQSYIPIYTKQEIESYQETGETDNPGNTIWRG